jgi:hypothetical protein
LRIGFVVVVVVVDLAGDCGEVVETASGQREGVVDKAVVTLEEKKHSK